MSRSVATSSEEYSVNTAGHTADRAAWRERIVEAERGLKTGFRGSSTLFFYFFGICMVLSAGFVLGMSAMQWAVIVLSTTITVAGELIYCSINRLAEFFDHAGNEEAEELLISLKAGFTLLVIGSVVTNAIIIITRFMEVYQP